MKGSGVQILVDDQPYMMTGPSDQTVGELANEVSLSNGGSEGRFVVSLRCDGQAVGQQELASILQTPAQSYDRLDLQTQPVKALVCGAIEQAIAVLEDSTHAREKAADFLAAGQQEPAMRELQRFMQAWKQIHQTLVVSAQVLHIDLDAIRVGDTALTDVLEALKTQFTNLHEAMVQADFVVVGDILRYELAEPLSQLALCVRGLTGRTG
jgi:hypothetical protein